VYSYSQQLSPLSSSPYSSKETCLKLASSSINRNSSYWRTVACRDWILWESL